MSVATAVHDRHTEHEANAGSSKGVKGTLKSVLAAIEKAKKTRQSTYNSFGYEGEFPKPGEDDYNFLWMPQDATFEELDELFNDYQAELEDFARKVEDRAPRVARKRMIFFDANFTQSYTVVVNHIICSDSELSESYEAYAEYFLRPLLPPEEQENMASEWSGEITAGLVNDTFVGSEDIGVEFAKNKSMDEINFALLHRNLVPRDTTKTISPDHPTHFTDYEHVPSWPFFNRFTLRWHQRGGALAILRKWFQAKPGTPVGVWCTDSVGLGKTAQTIACISMVRHYFTYFKSLDNPVLPPAISKQFSLFHRLIDETCF